MEIIEGCCCAATLIVLMTAIRWWTLKEMSWTNQIAVWLMTALDATKGVIKTGTSTSNQLNALAKSVIGVVARVRGADRIIDHQIDRRLGKGKKTKNNKSDAKSDDEDTAAVKNFEIWKPIIRDVLKTAVEGGIRYMTSRPPCGFTEVGHTPMSSPLSTDQPQRIPPRLSVTFNRRPDTSTTPSRTVRVEKNNKDTKHDEKKCSVPAIPVPICTYTKEMEAMVRDYTEFKEAMVKHEPELKSFIRTLTGMAVREMAKQEKTESEIKRTLAEAAERRRQAAAEKANATTTATTATTTAEAKNDDEEKANQKTRFEMAMAGFQHLRGAINAKMTEGTPETFFALQALEEMEHKLRELTAEDAKSGSSIDEAPKKEKERVLQPTRREILIQLAKQRQLARDAESAKEKEKEAKSATNEKTPAKIPENVVFLVSDSGNPTSFLNAAGSNADFLVSGTPAGFPNAGANAVPVAPPAPVAPKSTSTTTLLT